MFPGRAAEWGGEGQDDGDLSPWGWRRSSAAGGVPRATKESSAPLTGPPYPDISCFMGLSEEAVNRQDPNSPHVALKRLSRRECGP